MTADLASPVRAYRPHFLGPEDTEDPIPSPERSPKKLFKVPEPRDRYVASLDGADLGLDFETENGYYIVSALNVDVRKSKGSKRNS